MIPLDPEYGPARTIPHPVMFRVLDSEAEEATLPAALPAAKGAEWAYYPGCIDYYDQEMQFSHLNYGDTDHGIIFDSSIKLLKAVGIEPVILDRSFMKCCGHDQLWQGKIDVFQKMRDYNTKVLRMLGVKNFVTSCAEGYRTFKLDYQLKGVKVWHITQVLYERGLRFPPPKEGKTIRVTYQDPCRSCRQMPVDPIYDEPRALIERVENAELVELKTFRGDAQCCGVAQMMYCNDKTKGLTASRMNEAKQLDVDYLLTACPKCLTHFGCLHHENRWKPEEERYRYRVIDITHFLAERLEGEAVGRPPSVIPVAQDPRQKGVAAKPAAPAAPAAAAPPPRPATVPAAPAKPAPAPPAAPAAAPPKSPPAPEEIAKLKEEAMKKAQAAKAAKEPAEKEGGA